MGKLRALFHPIMVFIGVQIAWIVLMAVWINWYLENNLAIKEFAQKIRPDLFTAKVQWLILFEGCFLMLLILAGVYVIFVYWNKQNRLNQMQSNFVASVSHELKSPLASIQLYLETMKYQDVSNDERNDFVEMMKGMILSKSCCRTQNVFPGWSITSCNRAKPTPGAWHCSFSR